MPLIAQLFAFKPKHVALEIIDLLANDKSRSS